MNSNVGIYQIRNVITGDIYIGQSINLAKRKYNHFYKLKLGKHNPILQNSYNKHGTDNFVFEVLLLCDASELDKHEQELVNKLNPKYNVCKEVTTSVKGTKFSKDHKKKLSYKRREYLRKVKQFGKGKDHPWYWMDRDEVRILASKAGIG